MPFRLSTGVGLGGAGGRQAEGGQWRPFLFVPPLSPTATIPLHLADSYTALGTPEPLRRARGWGWGEREESTPPQPRRSSALGQGAGVGCGRPAEWTDVPETLTLSAPGGPRLTELRAKRSQAPRRPLSAVGTRSTEKSQSENRSHKTPQRKTGWVCPGQGRGHLLRRFWAQMAPGVGRGQDPRGTQGLSHPASEVGDSWDGWGPMSHQGNSFPSHSGRARALSPASPGWPACPSPLARPASHEGTQVCVSAGVGCLLALSQETLLPESKTVPAPWPQSRASGETGTGFLPLLSVGRN